MNIHYANPSSVPAPLGRYSTMASVPIGGEASLVFIAGQVGNTSDGQLPDDFRAQARQAFTNVFNASVAAGGSPHQIVRLTTYLVDENDFGAFVEVRNAVFAETYKAEDPTPPHTLMVVKQLSHPSHLIEIDAVVLGGTGGISAS